MSRQNNHDDIEFLKDDLKWPNIVCPVKKYEDRGFPKCGIVCSSKEPVVRILNMFAGWTPEQFEAAERYEYESFEAMVADGWMVD